MNDIIETFIENNDVTFKLVAIVNGEEVVKYESDYSFDDVSGFSDQADEAFNNYVIQQAADLIDYRESMEADELIQDRSY